MAPPVRSTFCRERGGRFEEARLIEGAGGSDIEGTPGEATWADVFALPPLPDQDLCQMRGEACCGNTLVIFLICLFVTPLQAAVSTAEPAQVTFLMRVWLIAIYTEAAIAIFCLFGLMWGDPGTIKRTPENCFPQPAIVSERLRNGQGLGGVGNVTEDGRIFCIRCLVWRPDNYDTHHCSTCQRCVNDFDHHCGVFGRCIAGNGLGGNMGYFKGLILMGVVGCATCVSFMFISAASLQHNVAPYGSRYPHRTG